MRRREKFVLSAAALSMGLFAMQYLGIQERYIALLGLVTLSYGVASWALAEDLQSHERITIVPFSTLYTLVVGLFYFILPQNVISLALIIGLFGVGMYALFLVGNIFSVAKGRSIQLLHAAHAIQILASIGMSLMFTNVIFSFNWSFALVSFVLGLFHLPLFFMTFWSFELGESKEQLWKIFRLAFYASFVIGELGLVLSLLPFSIWYRALFVMSISYIAIGLTEHSIKGKLFDRTLTEYGLVFGLVLTLFIVLFPKK